jgi:hypothetical protein
MKLEMKFEESMTYLTTVEWKTIECDDSECWCRLIVPKEELFDEDNNEIYVAASGCISKEHAEHIVKIHNESLKIYKDKNI